MGKKVQPQGKFQPQGKVQHEGKVQQVKSNPVQVRQWSHNQK